MNDILSTRPNSLDYAKCIAMFMVIYCHYNPFLHLSAEENISQYVRFFFSSFNIPLFFLISGYLTKYKRKGYLHKIWKQLIIPYILMAVVCMAIGFVFDYDKLSIKNVLSNIIAIFTVADLKGGFSYSLPLWFLASIAELKLMVYIIERYKIRMGGVILLILSLITFALRKNIFPFRLEESLIAYMFFGVGYYFKNIINAILGFRLKMNIILILVGLGAVLPLYILNIPTTEASLSLWGLTFGKYPILFILSGFGGTIATICFCNLIKLKSNIVLTSSKGMLAFVGFHHLIYSLILPFRSWSNTFVEVLLTSIFVYFVCYILLVLCGKYCPQLIGFRK